MRGCLVGFALQNFRKPATPLLLLSLLLLLTLSPPEEKPPTTGACLGTQAHSSHQCG